MTEADDDDEWQKMTMMINDWTDNNDKWPCNWWRWGTTMKLMTKMNDHGTDDDDE